MRHQLPAALGAVILFCSAGTSLADPMTGPVRGVALNSINVNIHGATVPIGSSGDTSTNGINWLLDNIDDDQPDPSPSDPYAANRALVGPIIDSQLDNLLDTYQNAGVNMIRLVISPIFLRDDCTGYLTHSIYNPNVTNSLCNDFAYPNDAKLSTTFGANSNTTLFKDVNDLLKKINDHSPGKFQVEITLSGMGTYQGSVPTVGFECESLGGSGDTTTSIFTYTDNSGNFHDNRCSDNGDPNQPSFNHPFGNVEEYLYGWFQNVIIPNISGNIGLTEIGATLRPCAGTSCDVDDLNANAESVNNGEYIRAVWAWEQATFPPSQNMLVTYETAPQGKWTADPGEAQAIAHWANAHTPGLPYISMSIYVQENPGSSVWTYESAVNAVLLDYYAGAGGTPLWIDETGGQYTFVPAGQQNPNPYYSLTDAQTSLIGFLSASTCQAGLGKDIPKIIWIGDDDLNTNQLTTSQQHFGLVSGFDTDNNPIMQPYWVYLSQWYWRADAASPGKASDGVTAVVMNSSVRAQLLPCGISQGTPAFSVVQAPAHGAISALNSVNGAFTYTPNHGFWGADRMVFGTGSGPNSGGTETIYVYNPALMSVFLN
ncbi:MAG TPA: hypothetical protein VGH91_12110 [Gammaproteobacteria bacterium]|jgi:hypothetical protein